MSRVYDIAHRYVDEIAALDPNLATAIGVPGHEREMTDYSPAGPEALAVLNRRTVGELRSAQVEEQADEREAEASARIDKTAPFDHAGGHEQDRIAAEVMLERLGVHIDLFEAGEHFHDLNNIASPLQDIRQVFDQMARNTQEEWSNIAARLALVPEALAGYRETLSHGLDRRMAAATRQVKEGARQADVWSGDNGFLAGLTTAFDKAELGPETLRTDLGRGTRLAREAYTEMARWLREDYAPNAETIRGPVGAREGCGDERYGLLSRVFLGASINPKETYERGWGQLHEVEQRMAATAELIIPGGSVADAREVLESDPARAVEGVDAYREWLQTLHDETVASLHGVHFEIDEKVRRIEVMIPPAGGALIPYYTGPSEDFSRAGRTWWPVDGLTRFPKWGDVSIAYHEGVPGHHLQVGGVRALGDELSRFQRMLTFISGHGEGWALYAERLMGELGYLEEPGYYLGMLSAQALRCVRVIIDIGVHLEVPIPQGEAFHPGEVWNHDLMLEFAVERTQRAREFLASEVVRYLGWPAQAISYKVGEQKWLEARDAARNRMGASFDLKAFHMEALALGPMGLEMLGQEMSKAK
jgi:uncharacterized protein (DUF885 family)